MRECLVIMPYGGEDPKQKRFFDGVFRSIIAPAVLAAGLEPKRSDLAAAPGNITADVIRDLCNCDMVVADLTSANPNVFFELGVRHAFRKSGTVHIIHAEQPVPFDLRPYRVIKYSADLAEIPASIQSITDAIRKRFSQPNLSDNPVHDALPELPNDIRATGAEALTQQLKEAQQNLESLQRENERLCAEIAKYQPPSLDSEQIDIEDILNRAEEIMKSKGQHVILRLHRALQDGGPEALALELRTVLKSAYLDENDYMEIVVMCKEAGLEEHRRATLEIARQRYPFQEKIMLALADALDDSPAPADQTRARTMLEGYLGIEQINGLPVLKVKGSPAHFVEALALLFNIYMRQRRWEWILSVTDSVPQKFQQEALILRNRARALSKLNRIKEAESEYRRLLDLYPNDDQVHLWYSGFLEEQGRFAEAYEFTEKAILADPDDPRLYLSLAIDIFNHGYYRTSSGEIKGPMPRKLRGRVATPLVLRAVEVGRRTKQILEEAVRVLVRGEALEAADAVSRGEIPSGEYNLEALQWVEQQLIEKRSKATSASD